MPGARFDPDRDFAHWTPEQQKWWTRWRKKSRTATLTIMAEAAIGVYPDVEAQQKVWSELKLWLADNFFHKKCAYCDRKVDPKFETDAEHYRPKGGVTRKLDNTKSEPILDGSGEAHKGYYWFAVNWRNLLPSCKRCNNQKSSHFPVGGSYLFAPPNLPPRPNPADDKAWAEALWRYLDSKAFWDRHETEEQPLLLDPNSDDGAQDLIFEETGVILARPGSIKAQQTLGIVAINHPDTVGERKQGLEMAIDRLNMAMQRHMHDPNSTAAALPVRITGELQAFISRESEYHRFFFHFVSQWMQAKFGIQLPDP